MQRLKVGAPEDDILHSSNIEKDKPQINQTIKSFLIDNPTIKNILNHLINRSIVIILNDDDVDNICIYITAKNEYNTYIFHIYWNCNLPPTPQTNRR